MDTKKRNGIKITFKALLLVLVFVSSAAAAGVSAAAATAVSIGTIDYDRLTMQVYYNNNAIVYYSTDGNIWTEVEGAYNSTDKSCTMDISWVSQTSDVTLYFKGDVVKTVKTVTLPGQNSSFKIVYDKIQEEFSFEDAEEAGFFEWRKATDYNWTAVSMEEASGSYQKFMDTIDVFHVSGAKLVIRIPQVTGTGLNNVGTRPSKEVAVTIPARAAAPSIKVNTSRLTLNTSSAMEYYDSSSGLWIECSTTMNLDEIAPEVLYENGGAAATLRIRKAATSLAPYSKTAYITIPGQAPPPGIGGSSADVTYYYMNSKLMLQFNHASASNLYEYAIVRPGADFNPSTASWKAVKVSTVTTISSASAPQGSTVYVRKKGVDADTVKGTGPVLASAVNSFSVEY